MSEASRTQAQRLEIAARRFRQLTGIHTTLRQGEGGACWATIWPDEMEQLVAWCERAATLDTIDGAFHAAIGALMQAQERAMSDAQAIARRNEARPPEEEDG